MCPHLSTLTGSTHHFKHMWRSRTDLIYPCTTHSITNLHDIALLDFIFYWLSYVKSFPVFPPLYNVQYQGSCTHRHYHFPTTIIQKFSSEPLPYLLLHHHYGLSRLHFSVRFKLGVRDAIAYVSVSRIHAR